MMSELTDVLKIIADCNETMNRIITKWEVEEGDQYPEGLTELRRILNTYTAQICRNIVKHEDKLVGNTLEGMEKYELKTDDGEVERMAEHSHTAIANRIIEMDKATNFITIAVGMLNDPFCDLNGRVGRYANDMDAIVRRAEHELDEEERGMIMPAVSFTIMPRNFGAFYYWNRYHFKEMLEIRQHCGMVVE